MEVASPEHDWQPDLLTRAYLRTSVVGADESPILCQNRYNGKSESSENSLCSDAI